MSHYYSQYNPQVYFLLVNYSARKWTIMGSTQLIANSVCGLPCNPTSPPWRFLCNGTRVCAMLEFLLQKARGKQHASTVSAYSGTLLPLPVEGWDTESPLKAQHGPVEGEVYVLVRYIAQQCFGVWKSIYKLFPTGSGISSPTFLPVSIFVHCLLSICFCLYHIPFMQGDFPPAFSSQISIALPVSHESRLSSIAPLNTPCYFPNTAIGCTYT